MTKGRTKGINKERQSHNYETPSRLAFSTPWRHLSLTYLSASACLLRPLLISFASASSASSFSFTFRMSCASHLGA